jgi:hypothetical protein
LENSVQVNVNGEKKMIGQTIKRTGKKYVIKNRSMRGINKWTNGNKGIYMQEMERGMGKEMIEWTNERYRKATGQKDENMIKM